MRRPLFFCTMLIGMIAVIEGISLALYRVQLGTWPSPSALRDRARELAEETAPDVDDDTDGTADDLRYVAHPYLGYAINPRRSGTRHNWWIASHENPFDADPDGYFVAIVGGSVAFNLRMGREVLEQELRRLPELPAQRPIVYVNLAAPGYKQPQQLIAVNYYLALGGRIDLLVNLDGFNEVASAIDSNVESGVYPLYPSFWAEVTRDWADPSALEALQEVHTLRKRRARIASALVPLRYSPTVQLVFDLLDRRVEARIHAIASARPSQLPLHARGPDFPEQPLDEAARRASAELWARSSRLLAELARSHGFAYFHFLQPNQYVPGARLQFSPIETRLRLGNARHQRNVGIWYPELRKLGQGLRAQGVHFVDLTGLYRDVQEPVYVDDCCHLTPFGRQLLARAIGRTVVEAAAAQGREAAATRANVRP